MGFWIQLYLTQVPKLLLTVKISWSLFLLTAEEPTLIPLNSRPRRSQPTVHLKRQLCANIVSRKMYQEDQDEVVWSIAGWVPHTSLARVVGREGWQGARGGLGERDKVLVWCEGSGGA